MRFDAVTLAALFAVALLARAGGAQTSRPAKAPAGVEATRGIEATSGETANTVFRRPTADSTATTKSSATVAAKPSTGRFDTTRVALSLAIVLSLIFILRFLGKRLFGKTILGGRPSSAIQVLSRNVISPKQQLLVVRVGRRLVVVGDSGQQMNTLCEITDPEEMSALLGQIQEEKRETMMNGFGSLFGRAGSDFEKADEPPRSSGVAQEDDDVGENAAFADGAIDASPVRETRNELNGLMDKVRLMSRQFRRT